MNLQFIRYVDKDKYFRRNKFFLITTGLWPLRPRLDKIVRQATILFFTGVIVIPNIIGVYKCCGVHLAKCTENFSGLVFHLGVFAKFVVAAVQEKKVGKAYELLSQNWMTLKHLDEINILSKYEKIGVQKFKVYTIYLIVGGGCFASLILLPIILDFILPLSEPRQRLLIVRAEFIFDPYEYYYEVYFVYVAAYISAGLACLAVDGTFYGLIHHNLGLINIIKHRIILATSSADESFAYDTLVSAIEMHQRCLEFHNAVEEGYYFFFLVSIINSVIFLSGMTFTFLEAYGNDVVLDLIRMVLTECGIMLYLFYQSWPGQTLIDESDNLFRVTYMNEWYNISQRAKILMKMIMLRSTKPFFLTAGGFYTMNFQNFGSILKTTLSYITVLYSFR